MRSNRRRKRYSFSTALYQVSVPDRRQGLVDQFALRITSRSRYFIPRDRFRVIIASTRLSI